MNLEIIHNIQSDDLSWKVGDYFFHKETSEVYIVVQTTSETSLACLNDGGHWSSTNTWSGTFKDLRMEKGEWVKLNNMKIEVS